MGFEYAVTRLRGLHSRFISDAEVESIAAGRDLSSIMLVLGDSVFAEEADRLKGRGRDITLTAVLRCVEDGHAAIAARAADILREWNPDATAFIFARMELELIKEALRCIRLAEPAYDKRLRFFSISGMPQWADKMGECRSVAQFKELLLKLGHPFADPIDLDVAAPMAELNMERFFFNSWLARNGLLAAQCGSYFGDWNDMVNLHTALLLRGRLPEAADARPYFVRGPGRVRFTLFVQMIAMSEADFHESTARLLGLPLSRREGEAGFALALREAYLRKWKLGAITRPTGPYEIMVFLEELDVMAANLKLAIGMAGMGRERGFDPLSYLVRRQLAAAQ